MESIRKWRRSLHRCVSYVRHPFGAKCLDCGFLCLSPDREIQEGDRTRLACGGSIGLPNIDSVCCYRGLRVVYETACVAPCWDGLSGELESERRGLPGFLKHRAGWSPTEHKGMLQRL